MFGDGMIAALDKAIDAASDDDAALSREQREVQEAQIMADMLAIERKECALIFEAERQGSIIHFRNDCSPQAVLGVRLTVHLNGGGRLAPVRCARIGNRGPKTVFQPRSKEVRKQEGGRAREAEVCLFLISTCSTLQASRFPSFESKGSGVHVNRYRQMGMCRRQ